MSNMYIRTKDGIYEVVTAERVSDNKLLYIISTSKTENTTDWVHEADVISQADTIEELCDKFVVKTCGVTEYWVEQKLECAKMYFGVEIIYGTICTDKGLIFVAKMNDKGDLELI